MCVCVTVAAHAMPQVLGHWPGINKLASGKLPGQFVNNWPERNGQLLTLRRKLYDAPGVPYR